MLPLARAIKFTHPSSLATTTKTTSILTALFHRQHHLYPPKHLQHSNSKSSSSSTTTQYYHTRHRTMATTTDSTPKTRSYPTEPRVGIGIVVLRHINPTTSPPEVLLIKRCKPPSMGMWSFPGGSLELGETIMDCAIRETLEETGIILRNRTPGQLYSIDGELNSPVAFAGVDVISKDQNGALDYHYAIIEVAAVPEDPYQEPKAAEDAADVKWFPVESIRKMREEGVAVVNLDQVSEEAVRRFKITH